MSYLRKRLTSEGPRRRRMATGPRVGLTDEQLDARNTRVITVVAGQLAELAGVKGLHPPARGDRSMRAHTWHAARRATARIAHQRYGIPAARLADHWAIHATAVSSWLRREDELADQLVSRWEQSGGPALVARDDIVLVPVTQEAAQALQTAASQGGGDPIALGSAALLAACAASQGYVREGSG